MPSFYDEGAFSSLEMRRGGGSRGGGGVEGWGKDGILISVYIYRLAYTQNTNKGQNWQNTLHHSYSY